MIVDALKTERSCKKIRSRSALRRAPAISILVSSFERPQNLRRTLAAIARQERVHGSFEVIVNDDGSQDETANLVARFARDASFPIEFVTHPHRDFQLARCRNEGVLAARADYLLFVDGDCLMPANHVYEQLRHRTSRVVMAGDYYYLDRESSANIGEREIGSGDYRSVPSLAERRRILRKRIKSRFYPLFGMSNHPRLTGGNIGICREDFDRVNGYDQNFIGWGFEDRDLQFRLSRIGIRFHSSLDWGCTYHLWHPRVPSFVRNGNGTRNRNYFFQPGRLTRPRNGLMNRSLDDLAVGVFWPAAHEEKAARLLRGRFARRFYRPEVEIVFLPGNGHFSGRADCNILVSLGPAGPHRTVRHANVVVGDVDGAVPQGAKQFPLDHFEQALESIT